MDSCQTAVVQRPADAPWVAGAVDTAAGRVPRVATKLSWADRLGAIRVRANMGRMRYTVPHGLYAVGDPTSESPVLVSANYKLSFDGLRRELGGLDAWILVLDTNGINVWCAAAGGHFSTDEIALRVEETGLARVVTHRTLILPQLAAPGVAAHRMEKRSGFRVVYGPVRAADIGAFLRTGMKATAEMRRVRFPLADRLAVVPVELALGGKHALTAMAALFLLAGLNRGGYDSSLALRHGGRAVGMILLAFLGGGVAAPALLPWLPGRAFSVKGAVVGMALACCVIAAGGIPLAGIGGKLEAVSWLLMMPAATAFMAMNFTGASTFTSLSGVKHEMRYAVPAQIVAGALGLLLWLAARFLH